MISLAAFNVELLNFVLLGLVIIFIGSILRYYRQPYVIAYILAGILMGKHGLQLLTDDKAIHTLGEFGLILLLFFIGMEISLPNLIKKWRIPAFGTLFQVLASILLVGILGWYLQWDYQRVIILGFIISLSSSAVVIKLIQDNGESQSEIGQNVISILLMQDILIVPMLIATRYLGGSSPTIEDVVLQIIGAIIIIGIIIGIIRKKEISLPFDNTLKDDRELQVIIAIIVCFGFSSLTALFGLSAALGAFVGGMVVHATRSTEWFDDSLHSFRVIFVALFFVSIGMLIDLNFLIENWMIILLILSAVYISNHFINSIVLYYFSRNWKKSFYGGALLAQIGELSFIISSTAYLGGIIPKFEYQLTIIVISLTLLISPFWIGLTKRIVKL